MFVYRVFWFIAGSLVKEVVHCVVGVGSFPSAWDKGRYVYGSES